VFAPETALQIEQRIIARILAFSQLSDVAATSQFGALVQSLSLEFSALDGKRAADRNSFFLLQPGIAYQEYKQRLTELPPTGLSMLPASPASGLITVSRADTSTLQTLPVNATVFSPANGCVYKVTQATIFGIGVGSVEGIPIVCTTVGAVGNCAPGDISAPQDVPSWVLAVTNPLAVTSGTDAETVPENQVRAKNFLSSLSRSQLAALEYAGTSFVASDGSRLRFAKGIRDFAAGPGYSLLMVDDGSGLTGLTSAGVSTSGTVPVNGITLLWHAKPATERIQRITVARAAGGTEYLYLSHGDYMSYPEVGIVYVPQGTLLPGDVWTIDNYNVYTGIVAELQNEIVGMVTNGLNAPGWQALGCDVRVVTPNVFWVQMWVSLVPKTGSTVSQIDLEQQVIGQIIAYVASLAPGQPLFIAQLIDFVMNNNNVLNVRFYEADQTPLLAKEDIYVQPTQAARTNASYITIISQAQG